MRYRAAIATTICLGTVLAFTTMSSIATAAFNPGRIIDDAVFNETGTMSATQIDAFLNQFTSSCISTNHGFSAPDPTGYNPTSGFLYGNNVSAGKVIYDAAQAYHINPQVILATLQKEQSLVDGAAGCNVLRYTGAAGYGCPDGGTTHNYSGITLYAINGVTVSSVNGTCVNTAAKAGFSQQVIHATWLLAFGEQRSEGNLNWAVVQGNWDNSDDPQSCYGGPMTEGTFARCPSGPTAFYDGYFTVDSTSIHLDNGATASLYWYTPHFPGNQNFYSIFTNWFGDTTLAYAFHATNSSTIYLYIDGYKVSVPAMGILQDYGFSPDSIQTLSQTLVDSVPAPPVGSGISTNISYLVKSPSDTDTDGGSIYLISVGKRYAVASMQQFADFNFSTSAISYLPLSYILSLPNGGTLSNFIKAPNGQVFQVSSGLKHVIFDYPTFIEANPSGFTTFVSYFDANVVPSGNPIANAPIIVKKQGSEAVTLFIKNVYYSIPTLNVFKCWGLQASLHVPAYRVADNSYLGAISPATTLSCVVNTGASNELLSESIRIPIPDSFGFTGTILDANTLNLESALSVRSTPLKQYVQPIASATVWFLINGTKRQVPTYAAFTLLKLTNGELDTISGSAIDSITSSGIKLGPGQVVKSPSGASVFAITGDQRVAYARSDDFIAYKNAWSSIESYPAALLDALYPLQSNAVSPYFYYGLSNNVYFVDPNGCYLLDTSLLTSFGKDLNTLKTNQTYDISLFPTFSTSTCVAGSAFVKEPGQALVYWVDAGQRHPVDTWNKLVAKSGTTSPRIMVLNPANIALLPLGSPL